MDGWKLICQLMQWKLPNLTFYCTDRHWQHFSIIAGPHHSSIYLALNAGQAASTGLRITYSLAATPTLLPGHAQGTQFMLLFHINATDTRGTEKSTAPSSSQRLEEKVIVHLCVVHIQVIFRNVIDCECICFQRWHSTILGQLEDRKTNRNKQIKTEPWISEIITPGINKDSSTPCTDFEFDGIKFLLFQMVPQHLPVAPFLFHGKLPESELPHPTVMWWHPQGAASLCGYTDKTLPPVEIVDCDAFKVHIMTS